MSIRKWKTPGVVCKESSADSVTGQQIAELQFKDRGVSRGRTASWCFEERDDLGWGKRMEYGVPGGK